MEPDVSIKEIKQIVAFVKQKYGYDFENYALESLRRRFSRILMLYNMSSVEPLIMKMAQDRAFTEQIVKEITVNTTEMFRDPAFWRKLKSDILPEISGNPKIRIWHAACSSGEEVYSMAILLNELNLLNKCQIVATDINDLMIERAQKGLYSKRNMELNESNYQRFLEKNSTLSQYYKEQDGDTVCLSPDLIANVTFRKHDLVTQDIFSKFDLIVCRNVFIYFNLSLQNNILKKFSDALFTNSYLALGAKESIAWCENSNLYNTHCLEEKIYKKN